MLETTVNGKPKAVTSRKDAFLFLNQIVFRNKSISLSGVGLNKIGESRISQQSPLGLFLASRQQKNRKKPKEGKLMPLNQNFEKLMEEIKQLPSEEQKNLLFYVKDKFKNKLPLAKETTVSIDLPLYPYRKESEHERLSASAQFTSFYAEAVFWLLKELFDSNWQTEHILEQEIMCQNLTFICQIGIALTSKSADLIDRAETLQNKEAENE